MAHKLSRMANTMPTNVQLTAPSYRGGVIANGGCSPLPPPQQPSRPKPSPAPQQQQKQQQQQHHQLLNVEAALSYLDQVKYKFRSHPQVYNELLHIMTEFKSQSIDTLALIERVTNLFKHHPELIADFTTILTPTRKKVQDVLSYLDQIQYKFSSQPQVYNEFIHIMTKFKSKSIDIPTVIQRVLNLFNGHPDLIVGFTTFLPTGYKIEVQSNNQGYTFQISFSIPSSVIGVPATAVVPAGRPSSPAATPVVPPSFLSLLAPSTSVSSSVASKMPPQQQLQQSPAHSISPFPNAQSAQCQPGELDHAINYVFKIKQRFTSQPEKFRRFLEIFRTYVTETKNVKDGQGHPTRDLYSQVAYLFQDQEDLLAEFDQFMADAKSHHSAVFERPASAQISSASGDKASISETVEEKQ